MGWRGHVARRPHVVRSAIVVSSMSCKYCVTATSCDFLWSCPYLQRVGMTFGCFLPHPGSNVSAYMRVFDVPFSTAVLQISAFQVQRPCRLLPDLQRRFLRPAAPCTFAR